MSGYQEISELEIRKQRTDNRGQKTGDGVEFRRSALVSRRLSPAKQGAVLIDSSTALGMIL